MGKLSFTEYSLSFIVCLVALGQVEYWKSSQDWINKVIFIVLILSYLIYFIKEAWKKEN